MDLQRLVSHLRKCIQDYHMIQEGDSIAIGLSGGKDSLTLLCGMAKLQQFYPIPFSLCAIYVDLGITDSTEMISSMEEFCTKWNVPFYVVSTDIYSIVFQQRREKNPCSLCAKLRKGALNQKALSLGCNKIAYAHHQDDFMETSMMSLFMEGHYSCFLPVTLLDRTGLSVLRPLLYVTEREITGYALRNHLPVFSNPCPADGRTKRQDMKEFIEKSAQTFPDIRKNLNAALLNYFDSLSE